MFCNPLFQSGPLCPWKIDDANYFQQTLEDMDLIFGDTAAHEEKKRIKRIEAELRGTPIEEDDIVKPVGSHVELA